MDTITLDDIKLAEEMWKIRQKGLFYNTEKVTNLYNKLHNTHLTPTNCGGCIRKRIDAIHSKIEEYKKLTEDGKEKEEKSS